MNLLLDAQICATVPTADLERARTFYEQKLGLQVAMADERRGVYYQAGNGTLLNLYERDEVVSGQTVATFLVNDLKAVMAALRKQDITFEEYDLPELKTVDGIYSDQTGFMVAWFKDVDGNILSIEQLPATL